MASSNAVPSRAVLNALRGMVFTTSCSVVVLAEERRRRIKIARSAIDNARKLHMVSGNRASLALTEAGSWECRDAEARDGALSPLPRTTGVRRKRRDSRLFTGQLTAGDGLDSLAENLAERHPLQGTKAVESRSTTTQTPTVRDVEGTNPETRGSPLLRNSSTKHRERMSKPAPAAWRGATYTRIVPRSTTTDRVPTRDQTPPSASTTSNTLDVPGTASLVTVDAQSFDIIQIARHCLAAPICYDMANKPIYDDILAGLVVLLTDLESSHLDLVKTSERIDLAMAMMEKIALGASTMPRSDKRSSLIKGERLLKMAASKQPTKIVGLLVSMLPLCADIYELLVPFMLWLQENKHGDVVEHTFHCLSDKSLSHYWKDGVLVYNLLCRFSKDYRTSSTTTVELYHWFLDAGLFNTICLPQDIEFDVRFQMAMTAFRAGDDSLAEAEMNRLYELDFDATMSGYELQSARILRDGQLGLWKTVQHSLEAFEKTVIVTSTMFQRLLDKLVRVRVELESIVEFDSFIRHLIRKYDMDLEERLAFRVLEMHAKRQDLQSTKSWLEFCRLSGMELTSGSKHRYWSSTLKYWGYSDRILDFLGVITGSSKPMPKVEDSAEEDVMRQLHRLSRGEMWDRVCELYDATYAAEGFHRQRFRLYVNAHVKLDRGNWEQTSAIVREAHVQGHDVSQAVDVLLMAQLNQGNPPVDVIGEALRQGMHVHASLYNKAAQKLMQRRDFESSILVCELAAERLGSGQLCFNEYNFSNLVFAYTGTSKYEQLQLLLAEFISMDWLWWQSSTVCRESVKLAIKLTTRREVKSGFKAKAPHEEALRWLKDTMDHILSRPTQPIRQEVLTGVVSLAGLDKELEVLRLYGFNGLAEAGGKSEEPLSEASDETQSGKSKETLVDTLEVTPPGEAQTTLQKKLGGESVAALSQSHVL